MTTWYDNTMCLITRLVQLWTRFFQLTGDTIALLLMLLSTSFDFRFVDFTDSQTQI